MKFDAEKFSDVASDSSLEGNSSLERGISMIGSLVESMRASDLLNCYLNADVSLTTSFVECTEPSRRSDFGSRMINQENILITLGTATNVFTSDNPYLSKQKYSLSEYCSINIKEAGEECGAGSSSVCHL